VKTNCQSLQLPEVHPTLTNCYTCVNPWQHQLGSI